MKLLAKYWLASESPSSAIHWHKCAGTSSLAGLFDLVGSVTNQVMAIYEMGPWARAVEHAVVDAVGEQLGFKAARFLAW